MDRKMHVDALRLWIEERLNTPLSVKDICKKSGFSEWYLQTLFRQETGYTINEYLTFRRLYKCALAVKFTCAPISQIAQRYCFGSLTVFSRTFRRVFGTTPTQFRIANEIDFSALAESQSVIAGDCPPPKVDYVYFDGLLLFGLSGKYSIDPHDFDRPHIHLKAPLECEFIRQTRGKFSEVYDLIHFQRDAGRRDHIDVAYSIGLTEKQAHSHPQLAPLAPLYGDYLMFSCKNISAPFFRLHVRAYQETMFRRGIVRRPGPEVAKVVWRDNPNQPLQPETDYSFMLPVIFDEKAHALVTASQQTAGHS